MPRAVDGADQVHRLIDLGAAQAGHHLVQQQQARLHRQRLGQLQPLAAADRQALGRVVAPRREVDELEDLVGLAASPRAAERPRPPAPYIAPTATFSSTVRLANGRTT